jgi:hypothetical protein
MLYLELSRASAPNPRLWGEARIGNVMAASRIATAGCRLGGRAPRRAHNPVTPRFAGRCGLAGSSHPSIAVRPAAVIIRQLTSIVLSPAFTASRYHVASPA